MKKNLRLNLLIVIAISLLWTGCTTTKVSKENYAGKYNYVITTPMGEQSGYVIINRDGDKYTGIVGSDQGTTPIQNLVVEGNKLTGNFEFMSYDISMDGLFSASALEGKFVAEGYEIPYKAVKEQ